jgi:hypothetical protein
MSTETAPSILLTDHPPDQRFRSPPLTLHTSTPPSHNSQQTIDTTAASDTDTTATSHFASVHQLFASALPLLDNHDAHTTTSPLERCVATVAKLDQLDQNLEGDLNMLTKTSPVTQATELDPSARNVDSERATGDEAERLEDDHATPTGSLVELPTNE